MPTYADVCYIQVRELSSLARARLSELSSRQPARGARYSVYSVYLLYWYKSTNTDAARLASAPAIIPGGWGSWDTFCAGGYAGVC
jgi:hypothetical protein